MPRKRSHDPELLALVDEIREQVLSGEVKGLFAVMEYASNEPPDYDVAYHAVDLDDMLLAARQQVTRVRSRLDKQ